MAKKGNQGKGKGPGQSSQGGNRPGGGSSSGNNRQQQSGGRQGGSGGPNRAGGGQGGNRPGGGKPDNRSGGAKPQGNRPGGGGGKRGPGNMGRDMTAERQYTSQLAKANRLLEEDDYQGALEILLPMSEKYPARAEVQELLGVSFVAIGLYDDAREAFEGALQLTPKGGEGSEILRFNLAHMYLLTGFPLLAYEQTQGINWFELTQDLEDITVVDEFRGLLNASVSEMAEQNGQPVEEFLRLSLPLERGQLALQRDQLPEARAFFEEAIKLNPQSADAYTNLANVSLQEGNIAEAVRQAEYVLEKLAPQDFEALSTLVRVYHSQGQTEQTRCYLDQIKALPAPEDIEGKVRLAEIFGLVEDDQTIYDLLRPLFNEATDWEEIEPAISEEAALLAGVAAAHLGKPDEALEIVQTQEDAEESLLLGRTALAFENAEEGPRPGGRFYYTPVPVLYPTAFRRYEQLLIEIMSNPDQYRTGLVPFFKEFGPVALDIVTFQAWLLEDPVVMAGTLTQTLAAQASGGVEMVRRFAFGRAGTIPQHLVAAAVLIEENVLPADKPVAIWFGDEQRTGTIEALSQMYEEEVGPAEE